jgi:hypothetical protein
VRPEGLGDACSTVPNSETEYGDSPPFYICILKYLDINSILKEGYFRRNDIELGFMTVVIFWNIAPYMNQRFGRTYHLHLQDKKSTEQDTSVRPSKRRFPYGLHGAISQKRASEVK